MPGCTETSGVRGQGGGGGEKEASDTLNPGKVQAAVPLPGQAALSLPVWSPGPGRDWRERQARELGEGTSRWPPTPGPSVRALSRVVATRADGLSTARKLFLL
ncbi:unnamed protein product [Rangifer tarandus platyrhynchus]|uniref:Uncharacterized protein n=1 Tax=Rangifer tarandus platyrhynchus TaxID=3082113 RepID=A0AC59YXJ7_RANTA